MGETCKSGALPPAAPLSARWAHAGPHAIKGVSLGCWSPCMPPSIMAGCMTGGSGRPHAGCSDAGEGSISCGGLRPGMGPCPRNEGTVLGGGGGGGGGSWSCDRQVVKMGTSATKDCTALSVEGADVSTSARSSDETSESLPTTEPATLSALCFLHSMAASSRFFACRMATFIASNLASASPSLRRVPVSSAKDKRLHSGTLVTLLPYWRSYATFAECRR
mmetsp:Transcript_24115/g.55082  ORF Transcript_24115/g.55082 Transcript_24115/m.55082 type:complete len:220 (+) Transcript_24115:16-675(+)